MTDTPTLQFSPDARPDSGLKVDLNRLVAGRGLIQGNPGAGKSWLIRYMLEQTYGAIPHLVLDPEGEFYTLRETYGYVWAGAGGEADVPLHPDTAQVMARRFVEIGASVVLDLYELSLGERRDFVARFCDELVRLPKRLWKPVLVILDEAHQYAPQQGSVVSSGAVISLCTLGRKRGFTPIMATQRMAKLDKDAVASLQNKFIGRTDLDNDVRRAADHLGLDKAGRHELRHLEPGTFFSYGPALDADGVVRARSGDVQTTHPEPGEITPSPPPPPDEVRDMLGQLEGMAEEAEEEERRLQALEEKVQRLKGENDRLRSEDSSESVPENYVSHETMSSQIDAAVKSAQAETEERFRGHVDTLEERLVKIGDRAERIREAAGDIVEIARRNGGPAAAPLPDSPSTPEEAEHEGREVGPPQSAARTADASTLLRDPDPRAEGLSGPEQRILNALATLHALGVDQPENEQAAAFAGYKTGGYWRSIRGSLSTDGLLEYPSSGLLRLTPEGARYATAAEIESVEEVHRLWFDLCSGPQKKLLRVLIDTYPRAISSEELAERSGYSQGGYFRSIRGKLSTMGALEYPETGMVRATDLLFPETLVEG